MTRKIIVVAGVERSGTTLAQHLLAGHSELAFVSGELTGFSELRILSRETGIRQPRSSSDMERLVEALLRRAKLLLGSLDIAAAKSLAQRYPIAWDSLFLIFIEQISRQFPDKPIVVKHPAADTKMRMVHRLLSKYHWDSRFLYMVRNPLDVYRSYRNRVQVWKSGFAHTDTLSQCGRWMDSTSHALEFERLYSEAIRIVRYEDMVADPVATCRKLCNWMGIKDEADALVHRDLGVNSSFALDHVKPAQGGVLDFSDRPQEELSAAELELYQVACGDRAKRFGYQLGEPRTDPRNYEYLDQHMSLSRLHAREYVNFLWRDLRRRSVRMLLTAYSMLTRKHTTLQLKVTPGPPPPAER